MSPPSSEYFEVQEIPGAGRGVVTSCQVPFGTVVLDTEPPNAHVVFRPYRREVCAHCFQYDGGRTLAVRESDTGKVFCGQACSDKWRRTQGELGLSAWQALQNFVLSKCKALADVGSAIPRSEKPNAETVDKLWSSVAEQVGSLGRLTPSVNGGDKKHRSSTLQTHMKQINPDILGLFLSGVVFNYQRPETWEADMHSLAMDSEPYRSLEDLEAHCSAFVQLYSILPAELLPSCSASLCRVIAEAGSHNAFGIRSGSEEGEEYMGWAIYPTASYLNHSCRPNINKRRIGSAWEFMTAESLPEGEQCCISYLGGDEKELTVTERRQRLKEAWGFTCMCQRCQQEEA